MATENLTLFISARSPFARRVRLILEELNAPHQVVVVDVFNPPSWLKEVNPFERVPALKIATGECLIESPAIQNYLREKFSEARLFQRGGLSAVQTANWSSIAFGIMEMAVQWFLESIRPPGMRLESNLEEFKTNIDRGLKALEQDLKAPFFSGDELKIWDLDIGSALAYVELRVGRSAVARYPKLTRYLDHLKLRASFQKTAPPPA